MNHYYPRIKLMKFITHKVMRVINMSIMLDA